jgi:glutamyl-tRNA synthetase/glutamyl-Q tRNA(Asp) synthetase
VSDVLTRFAPAPTGWLHLGHVVNALYVWGLGRARGARVLLRIEDHDRQRARPEYERALLDELDWLGFVPDLFPTAAFRAGRCASRQQDRHEIYARAATRLDAAGLLYGCRCSRRDLATAATGGAPQGCVDRCEHQGLGLAEGLAWRLRMTPDEETVDDLLAGSHRFDPSADGDVVIRDRLGNWTYQFAVSVDDLDQAVDLVIRGRDLLDSTGRQIQIARRLGRLHPPVFAHHPLLMKSAAQKLSKSDGDTGIRALAAAGWSAAQVIGEAAFRIGLVPSIRPLRAADAPTLFD